MKIATIVRAAAAATGITEAQIRGGGKTRRVAMTRQCVMFLAHRAGHPGPKIARELHKVPSTIYHGRRLIAVLVQTDDEARDTMTAIWLRLGIEKPDNGPCPCCGKPYI